MTLVWRGTWLHWWSVVQPQVIIYLHSHGVRRRSTDSHTLDFPQSMTLTGTSLSLASDISACLPQCHASSSSWWMLPLSRVSVLSFGPTGLSYSGIARFPCDSRVFLWKRSLNRGCKSHMVDRRYFVSFWTDGGSTTEIGLQRIVCEFFRYLWN